MSPTADQVKPETAGAEETKEPSRRYRKVRVGIVRGDKMDKTIVVDVERQAMHPQFRKMIRLNKKLQVHDEQNQCRVGDRVLVVESRPLSKRKRWRVQKILEKAVERDEG